MPAVERRARRRDSSSALIPAGFGTLKQADIAIVLEPEGVHVAAIPLDESVIRTLAPDSYRRLRASLDSKRPTITQRASMRGVREPRVWYVRFYGRTPDARFVPTDLTVTSGGRDYRPFDVVADLVGLRRAATSAARHADAASSCSRTASTSSQPLVVSDGHRSATSTGTRNSILKKLDTERASIRARASGRP